MSYLIDENGKYIVNNGSYLSYIVDPNKLTGWTNDPTSPFDTLTTSGRDILHAIEAPGTYGRCLSNEQEVLAYGIFPESLRGGMYLSFDITWNSGTGDILLHAMKNGSSQGFSTYTYPGAGTYSKFKGEILFETANYSWLFVSPTTGIDFTIENATWIITNGTP